MPPKRPKKTPDQAKLERKHILEQQKRLKPGECLKYLKVFIGSNIFAEIDEQGKEYFLHNALVGHGMRYESSITHENIVFWERSDQQILVNNENNVSFGLVLNNFT